MATVTLMVSAAVTHHVPTTGMGMVTDRSTGPTGAGLDPAVAVLSPGAPTMLQSRMAVIGDVGGWEETATCTLDRGTIHLPSGEAKRASSFSFIFLALPERNREANRRCYFGLCSVFLLFFSFSAPERVCSFASLE